MIEQSTSKNLEVKMNRRLVVNSYLRRYCFALVSIPLFFTIAVPHTEYSPFSLDNFQNLVPVAGAQESQPDTPITVSETHGDWTVYCVEVPVDEEDTTRCVMEQRLDWISEDESTAQRVLTMTLAPRQEDNLEAIIITPFGLLLNQGMQLRIDEGPPFRMNFRTCLETGCVSVAEYSENIVREMKRGQKLFVTMVEASQGQPFQLSVSLRGFTAAHNRLIEVENS